MSTDDIELLQARSAYHPTAVHRRGDVVLRDAKPWTPSVHALLRHLEASGFDGAPRVVGNGFDGDGRETLTYIPGTTHGGRPPWDSATGPTWGLDACHQLGVLMRQLHDSLTEFQPTPAARWFAWSGEEMGEGARIISHRDPGPWNIISREAMPVAFIDWERAGPITPLIDLALLCWLNADLFDDIVAERLGLPSVEHRGRQLRAILDGYQMARSGRMDFVDRLIEVAVHSVAEEADEFNVRHETRSQDCPPELVWALSWRGRSAAWIIRHRRVLQAAL